MGTSVSAIITVTTPGLGTPPSPPTGLVISAVQPTGLNLQWTESATGDQPISYQPHYRVAGTSDWVNVIVGTAPPPATTNDLVAIIDYNGTTYTFFQATGTDIGDYVDPQGRFTQGCIKSTSPLPAFAVYFRSDKVGTPRDEVVFELGDLTTAVPFNMTAYNVTITKGGQTIMTQAVPQHWWHSRWRWQSLARPVTASTGDLIAAGLIPKYRSTAVTGTPSAPADVTYTPMSLAGIVPYMPTTGERPDIGPVTEYQGRYLCLGTANNLASLRAQLEASGTIPWHYRDQQTNCPLDVNLYPLAGAYWPGNGQSPYLAQDTSGTGITMDTAHVPALAYIPFVLTGDPYALEELQFCDAFALVSAPPASRGIFSVSQTRGMAWTVRTRAQLAKVTPPNVPSWLNPQAYYQTFLNQERDYILTNYVNSTGLQFVRFNLVLSGFNGTPEWPIPPSTYFPSWEQDMLTLMVGWIVTMGFSDWVPIHAYLMKDVLGRTNGTSGWPRAIPSMYRTQIRASGGATFNGTISGTTLTVSTVVGKTWDQSGSGCSGAVVSGQVISGGVAANTTIVSQLTSAELDGAVSKSGTYSVSITQTVALRAMTGAVTPFMSGWAAAWALRKQVFKIATDPTTVASGDQTYASYAQAVLANANSLGVAGALTAYTWLHGQLSTLAATDGRANNIDYKWAVSPT